jgi:peptidoglycan hydrolase-like protein with peptidoglycan-binding domain
VKKLAIGIIALAAIFGTSTVSNAAPAGSTPISQLNMAAAPSINQDGIRKVQTLLKDRGFDPGPVDGVHGPRTSAAIRAFQERFAIKETGTIDNQTLFALGAIDLAGPAGGE